MSRSDQHEGAAMTTAPNPLLLADLIAQGQSDAQCGTHFGLSKYAVRRLRRRWGIAARRPLPAAAAAPDLKACRWGEGDLPCELVRGLYGQQRYGGPR